MATQNQPINNDRPGTFQEKTVPAEAQAGGLGLAGSEFRRARAGPPPERRLRPARQGEPPGGRRVERSTTSGTGRATASAITSASPCAMKISTCSS